MIWKPYSFVLRHTHTERQAERQRGGVHWNAWWRSPWRLERVPDPFQASWGASHTSQWRPAADAAAPLDARCGYTLNVFGHSVSITITKPIYLYSSSCTHTAQGSTDRDWWYVDLEANYSIGYVRITTRDGYQNNGMLNTELLYIRLQIIGSHSFH